MADDNQIGLSAVFDSSDFEKGIASYNAAISDSDSATKSSAVSMESAIESMAQNVNSAFESVGASSSESSDKFEESIDDIVQSADSGMQEVEDDFQERAEASRRAIDEAIESIGDDFETLGDEAPEDVEKVTKSADDLGEKTQQTAESVKQSTSEMGSAWEGLANVGAAAWAGIGIVIAAATAEMYLAIDAALEVDSVMAELDFQIEKTGASTGITKEQVLGLADSLSSVAPIDDEVITQAITMGMRFDGVTKDNIEPLIKAAADLSISTGKSLPSAMRELALAVSDPDKAMRLLKDANITLTDAEMETLKGFKDTGDAAGATAFLVGRVNEKIGGLAETMGKTAKGRLTIFNTAIGNIQETLGGAFVESIQGGIDKLTQFASNPRILEFVANLGAQLGNIAIFLVDSIPDVTASVDTILATIEGIPAFFEENKPVIIGVLSAIGAAMLAFGINAAIGFAPVVAAALPVIAILAAIAGVVAIVYRAWTENWGGIQEKVGAAWAEMQPVFEQLQNWLSENIPLAIERLSVFWQETLLPAIVTVVGWIVDNVIPALVQIVQWLGTNVPIAIAYLGEFWTNVLLPAIAQVSDYFTNTLLPAISSVATWFTKTLIPAVQRIAVSLSATLSNAIRIVSAVWNTVLLPALTAIWGFISKSIIPLFQAMSNLFNAVVGLAIRTLAGLFDNILMPALRSVWSFIDNNILSVFRAIGDTVNGTVKPALESFGKWLSETALGLFEPFSSWLSGVFLAAWKGIQSAIEIIIGLMNTLASGLNSIQLPSWLTRGAPTSLELGLLGINKQLEAMSMATLPAVRYQMEVLGSVRDVRSMAGRSSAPVANVSNSNQSTNNYLFGARFSVENQSDLSAILQATA